MEKELPNDEKVYTIVTDSGEKIEMDGKEMKKALSPNNDIKNQNINMPKPNIFPEQDKYFYFVSYAIKRINFADDDFGRIVVESPNEVNWRDTESIAAVENYILNMVKGTDYTVKKISIINFKAV